MDIRECIRHYEVFGDRVFGHSRWWRPNAKYDDQALEDIIKTVIKDNCKEEHRDECPGHHLLEQPDYSEGPHSRNTTCRV